MTIGIYKITNTNSGKVYIGSSINIEQRHKDHLYLLKSNKHHSKDLQQSYNRTKNKAVFQFEVIEEVKDRYDLTVREQYYINLYDSYYNGYNCSFPVDSVKYITKNKKVRIRDRNFNEFLELYNRYNNVLTFGGVFLNRLLEKHYQSLIYKTVNNIIEWFLENYNKDIHIARFSISDNHFYLNVADLNSNEFACYRYDKGKMYNSYCDTNTSINNLKKNNIYDDNIHYLIDVPNFDFNFIKTAK